jgi:glycosyltransferase involved in cell wall biosynthesis
LNGTPQWKELTVIETRISVLLPALSGTPTIPKAVTSTLRALGPDDELLVLIDGSVRKNEQVEKIKDFRLRIFYRSEAKGITSGLNFLLAQAKGHLIARMDADDICLPGRFRRQLKKLERDNLDFVFSNAILFGSGVRPLGFLPQIPYPLDNIQIGLELAIRNPLVHPSMLAKKESIMALGGYNEAVAEDYELWIRAWTGGFKLGRSRGYGIMYRIHPGQLSKQANHSRSVASDPALSVVHEGLVNKLEALGLISPSQDLQTNVKQGLARTSLTHRLMASSLASKILDGAKSLIRTN